MQRAQENKGGCIQILADDLTTYPFLNDTKAQLSNVFVDLYAASKGPCIAKLATKGPSCSVTPLEQKNQIATEIARRVWKRRQNTHQDIS